MNFKAALSAIIILAVSFVLHSFTQPKKLVLESSTPQPMILDLYPEYIPVVNSLTEHPEFTSFDHKIERFVKQWEIVGAALAIVKDGRLVYAKGYGYADRERQIPAQPYHNFRIASVSKLVTAVGIMKLVEEGKLKLSDKVFGQKGILSEYKEIADPLALDIEVRHLLNHTAGWRNELRRDPMFAPLAVAEKMQVSAPPSIETTIRFMLSQTRYFEPGTFYDYSNFGYCVLGKIIEKITKMDYESYMKTQILQPMGIEEMQLSKNKFQDRALREVKYYTHENSPHVLSCYNTGDSASKAYEGTNVEGLEAAGAWMASPIDLMRFLVRIDGFEQPKDMLQAQTIRAMTEPPVTDSIGRLVLGWKSVDPEKWERTGCLASTNIVMVRQHDGLSWVFLTNTGSWRGPYFSYEIKGIMQRALKTIKKWPQYDLFDIESYLALN